MSATDDDQQLLSFLNWDEFSTEGYVAPTGRSIGTHTERATTEIPEKCISRFGYLHTI